MSISSIPKTKSDVSLLEANLPNQGKKAKAGEERSLGGNAHFQQLTQAGGESSAGSLRGPTDLGSAANAMFSAPVGKITQTGSNPTVEEVPGEIQQGEKKADVKRVVETRDIGVQSLGLTDMHSHFAGDGYAKHHVYDPRLTLAGNIAAQEPILDGAGIGETVVMCIPTKVVGSASDPDDHLCCGNTVSSSGLPLGKTYYAPDDLRDGLRPMTLADYDELGKTTQYPDTGVDWELGHAMLELKKSHPDLAARLWPAITGLVLCDENSIYNFMSLKKTFPGVFYLTGENTGMKEVVDLQNKLMQEMLNKLFRGPQIDSLAGDELAARLKEFEDSAIVKIFRYLGRAGAPNVFHCDSSDTRKSLANNSLGGGEYFSAIETIFKLCPDTTFMWPHLGGLGKFTMHGDDHVKKIRGVLERNKNVNIDMSWNVVADQFSANPKIPKAGEPGADSYDMHQDIAKRDKQIDELADLISDYPDRFFMGSDTLVSGSSASIIDTYATYRNWGREPVSKTAAEGGGSGKRAGLFDRLSHDVLDKIEFKNFEALMKKAKADGDYYERHVLDKDLAECQARIASDPKRRLPNNWPALPGNAYSGIGGATTAIATTAAATATSAGTSSLKRPAPDNEEPTRTALEDREQSAKRRRVSVS
ncbi:MAG: hypothetical protein V4636_20320 [Pseudomonadota bacterium]